MRPLWVVRNLLFAGGTIVLKDAIAKHRAAAERLRALAVELREKSDK